MLNSGESDASRPVFSVDDIPPSFIEQHRQCCARFMDWQTSTILSNIALFQCPLDEDAMQAVRRSKQDHAIAYVNRFCLRAIDDSDRVVPRAEKQVQIDVNVSVEKFCVSVDHFWSDALVMLQASDDDDDDDDGYEKVKG